MAKRRTYKPIQYAVGSPIYTAETHRDPRRRTFQQINWGSPQSTCPQICTLRVFDSSSGELLWQKNGFYVLGSSHSGKIFGVRYRKLSSSFRRKDYCIVNVSPNAITTFPTGNGNRFQLKEINGTNLATNTTTPIWTADIVSLETDGDETTVATDVFYTEGTECQANPPGLGMAAFMLGGYRFMPFGVQQKWLCNDDGLIITQPEWNGQLFPEAFDRDRLATTHRFIIPATVLFAVTTARPARWVFEINGTIVRVPLYGTASEFETALESAPGVVSATVTGGPACAARLQIDIEFSTASGQIKNAIVENASQSPPSTSTLTNGNSPDMRAIWDLNTFAPKVVLWPKVDPGPVESWSFTSDGDGVLTSGNWGAPSTSVFGAKNRSWSRLEWTMPGGTPNWGSFNRVWSVDLYAGMQQIQSTAGTTSITRGLSGVRGGKLAVTSTACRLTATLSGDFTTHVILDESDGSVVTSGWNGLLVNSQIRFDDGGEWYITGTRKRVGGQSYWEIPFVESYGTTSGGNDLRERDIGGDGISGMIVGLGGTPGGSTAGLQGRANSTTTTLQGVWLCRTESRSAQAEYPWGFYRRDTFGQVSQLTRRSQSTEWRILHGSTSSGGFTAHKSTTWYAFNVSLATVRADVEAWYGSVFGGGVPIARINVFGDDPFLAGQTPALPTWQLIQEIVVLRDNSGTPNPTAPLAPNAMDTIRIELRNIVPIVTHTIAGSNPADGVIEWQRHVGTKSGANALAQPVRVSHGQTVYATECNPDIDTGVYPRGAT